MYPDSFCQSAYAASLREFLSHRHVSKKLKKFIRAIMSIDLAPVDQLLAETYSKFSRCRPSRIGWNGSAATCFTRGSAAGATAATSLPSARFTILPRACGIWTAPTSGRTCARRRMYQRPRTARTRRLTRRKMARLPKSLRTGGMLPCLQASRTSGSCASSSCFCSVPSTRGS